MKYLPRLARLFGRQRLSARKRIAGILTGGWLEGIFKDSLLGCGPDYGLG
jgi:hypothetical protein